MPTSTVELQQLLDARRYELHVPDECDGWILALEAVVDGEAARSGGSTVKGGSEIVLLVRRNRVAKKVDYCWYTTGQVSRGIMNDSLRNAGVFVDHPEGP